MEERTDTVICVLCVWLNRLLWSCDLFQLDYCCSPRSLESVEDRENYTFIRVRAEKLHRTFMCVQCQRFKSASPTHREMCATHDW